MTENEILDKMIARLHDKGWIQGVIWEEYFIPSDSSFPLEGVKGKACLRGTADLCNMMQPFGAGERLSAVGDRLAAAIAELFPERLKEAHWDAVVKFNDHEDTTVEDVMLVVKHARGNDGEEPGGDRP